MSIPLSEGKGKSRFVPEKLKFPIDNERNICYLNQTYHISDSEWLVLRCLWKQSPMEIKDIVAMLQKETGWNANMVRTLVVRLQDKGVIAAKKHSQCQGKILSLAFACLAAHAACPAGKLF